MKLRMRALAVVATAVSIAGLTAMSATAASASVSPTAQLVFDDYTSNAEVYSIQIIGTNQNGVKEYACWTTPLTVNLIPNWWWSGDTVVWPYTSSNCSTGRLGTAHLNLTDSPTDPPYHCLEDIPPFSDWNPGSNWQNCRIQNQTPWNGWATGSLVWSHT